MPATARYLGITKEEIEAAKSEQRMSGTWAEIECPGDYELTLYDVVDHVSKTGNPSWKFIYTVETSTGPCALNVFLSFSTEARWKMRDVLGAHGIFEIETLDPNSIIGETIGGTIDFPIDRATGERSNFRDIVAFFPLVDAPEEAPAVL